MLFTHDTNGFITSKAARSQFGRTTRAAPGTASESTASNQLYYPAQRANRAGAGKSSYVSGKNVLNIDKEKLYFIFSYFKVFRLQHEFSSLFCTSRGIQRCDEEGRWIIPYVSRPGWVLCNLQLTIVAVKIALVADS